MKIYEALKEMIENKKTIKEGNENYDNIYKRVVTEDGVDIILKKNKINPTWDIGYFYLGTIDFNNNDWEIYEEKKEKQYVF